MSVLVPLVETMIYHSFGLVRMRFTAETLVVLGNMIPIGKLSFATTTTSPFMCECQPR